MVGIDLGCGTNKQRGFIGADRSPMPGVDVIVDFNEVLPFKNDSVDLLLASHSLEHARDLLSSIREVYRICRSGAQICIVAPYSSQRLNLVNPYHLSMFNEHTPRFWTNYQEILIDPEEIEHPHATGWGLSESDHSNSAIDLRLVRMEFFHFKKYRDLPMNRKRSLRRERVDVCDQIMYHLIVWKGDDGPSAVPFEQYLEAFIPFEPDYIQRRKLKESNELLDKRTKERDALKQRLTDSQNQLAEKEKDLASSAEDKRRLSELEAGRQNNEKLLQEFRSDNYQLRIRQSEMLDTMESLLNRLHTTKVALSKAQTETDMFSETVSKLKLENEELHEKVKNVEAMKSGQALLKAELEAANGLLAWYRAKEASWISAVPGSNAESEKEHKIDVVSKNVVKDLLAQLKGYRSTLSTRLASLFAGKDTLWDSISPAFSQIKSYTEEHFRRFKGARFILGDDLTAVAYREYRIPFKMKQLSIISLAVHPFLPASQGSVAVEVVSSDHRIPASASLPLTAVNPDLPTDFILSTPIADLEKNWLLKITVNEADVPVAVYELMKFSILSRHITYLPFVLFQ